MSLDRVNWRLVGVMAVIAAIYAAFRILLPDISLQEAIDDVAQALGDWTYLLVGLLAFGETGAFIGLVLPGEFAVILGGAVAGQGVISLPVILAIAWFSAFLGDTTGFTIGHRVGRGFVIRQGPKFGLTRERFRRVEGYFKRHGGKTIVLGRFLSLVRPLAPFIAAGSGMRYRDFVPYSILGTGLWAATFVLLGYFGSRSIDEAIHLAERGSFVFGSIIAFLVVVWIAVRFLRNPENRRRVVKGLEQRRLTRPVVDLGRRFRGPGRFALDRLTPGQGLGLELTTLLAILAVSVFVFVSYALVIVDDPGPTPGDVSAAELARDLEAGWLTAVAKVVTALGSWGSIVAVALISATVLANRSRWPEFWVLVIAVTLTFVLSNDFKDWTDRARPMGGLIPTPESKAFPSGHAAHSILYVWLGVTLSYSLRRGLPAGTALIVAGLVIAAAIGLTRVYLNVHYLSDVTGGWALGAAIFALCGIVALLVTHLRQNPRE